MQFALIMILRTSEVHCWISCTAFRNTNLEVTRRLHHWIRNIFQSLYLLHGLNTNVTDCSCSFLPFGINRGCTIILHSIYFLAAVHIGKNKAYSRPIWKYDTEGCKLCLYAIEFLCN